MSSELSTDHSEYTPAWQDGIIAALFAFIALLVIALMRDAALPGVAYHDLKSPTLFPLVIAYLMLGASSTLALRAWKRKGRKPSHHGPHPRYLRAVLGAITLIVYGYALFTVGFWLASSACIFAMGLLLNTQPIQRQFAFTLGIVAAVMPFLVIWIFKLFLAVDMPTGAWLQ